MATSILSAITYAQQLAQTDVNGISSVLGLAFANDSLENMNRAMYERDIDSGMLNEVTIPLTGATSYSFPNGTLYTNAPTMYALKTVSINTSGSTQANYLQANHVDVSNLQGQTSIDYLRLYQPTTYPLFDNYGDTFEVFPTLSAGNVKIKYWKVPTEYPDVGAPIVYPQTLDYRCISARIASLYYKSQNDEKMAQIYETEYQNRLQDIIRILAPGTQQPLKAQALNITGWQY